MKCPKCKGAMTEGSLHGPHGMLSLTEIRFLEKGTSKIGLTKKIGIKTKAYSCDNCGYIETYLDK